jgi:hypothetical protein
MPAQLAHWGIAQEVSRRFISKKKKGYPFFQGHPDDQFEGISKYVYLGSSGPDLPYYYDADLVGKLSGTAGKSEWADLFHYNKQGELVLQLVAVARGVSDTARQMRTMAYALGFTTHYAADTIIHPYVDLFAGAYNSQVIDEIHMKSEVHQDSYLAQKYFGRKSIAIQSDDGDTWKKYVPPCTQVGVPGLPAYTKVSEETQQVFSDVVAACNNTHGRGPDLEYLKDSYENFYDIAIDIGYDTAAGPIPKTPHMALVEHERIKSAVSYFPDLFLGRASQHAEDACQAVLDLFSSGFTPDDQNTFRSTVRNWNMDTGYWIDVTLNKGKLAITWRHRWC